MGIVERLKSGRLKGEATAFLDARERLDAGDLGDSVPTAEYLRIIQEYERWISIAIDASRFGYEAQRHLRNLQNELTEAVDQLDELHHRFDCVKRILADGATLADLPKYETAFFETKPEAIDLCELVTKVVAPFLARAEMKRQSLIIRVPDEPVVATTDRHHITRVVRDLAANGLKFSPRGGMVEIRLENREDEVALFMVDSGPGIAKKDLNQLFRQFSNITYSSSGQADDARPVGHTSIVYQLLEKIGGRISATSEQHEGSTFEVVLPKVLDR